jgi:hypothetical protein
MAMTFWLPQAEAALEQVDAVTVGESRQATP